MGSSYSFSRSVFLLTRRFFAVLIVCGSTFGLAVVLVTHTFGQIATAKANDTTNLELGQVVDRELKGGEKHLFQVSLVANQYAKVILRQRGIEVVVRQVDAEGKILAKYDSDPSVKDQVTVELASTVDGAVLLTVEPLQSSAPKGQYDIRLDETRLATPKDLARDEGCKLVTEVNRLWRANQYDQAIALAERAIEIETRELGEDAPELSTAIFALANQYNDKGEYDKAEPLFLRALAIREKAYGKDSLSLTGILTNLTSLYGDKGDYEKADAVARRALEIRERELDPNHPLIASVLNNLAIVNHLKGDDVKAAAYYQRVLDIREKVFGPNDPQVAVALNNMAGVYKDISKAEPLYTRALSIAEASLGPEHAYTGQILFNFAVLYDRAGDYGKAEPLCQRALSIYEKVNGPDHPSLAFPLDLLATINKNKGDYDKAESLYLRAIAIREKKQGPFHPYVGTTLANLANLYAVMGEIDKAVTIQMRANAILEYNISLNIVSGSERQKISYLKTFSGIENQTIALNLQTAPTSAGAADLAVTSILQRKGRVLDAVSDSMAALRRRSTTKDQGLLDTLNKTTQNLASFVLEGTGTLTQDDYTRKVKSLEEQRENLEAQIGSSSQGFYQSAKPVTLDAIRKTIPANAALIEFCEYSPIFRRGANAENRVVQGATGKPRYAVYVVHSQGDVIGIDLGPVEDIDNSLDVFRKSLRDPKSANVRELARRIDEKIMRQVRALIGTSDQLLISPEGELNLIPFEALVNEKGRFLVEDYSISYLASGRDLLRLNVPRGSKSGPLLIADPLFGPPDTQIAMNVKPKNDGYTRSGKRSTLSRRSVTSVRNLSEAYFSPLSGSASEARSIQSLLPGSVLLMGAGATETSLKQAIAPSILHIATHGFFVDEVGPDAVDRDNPLLRSGLAFAGANSRRSGADDGILTAMEASGLDLWGTKLVVLSACDTGLGEVRNGEGVFGLRRSFVQAGAESLVMSLWPVSDLITRDMMTRYYKNLNQGAGRGESLRAVQLDMIKRSIYKHPFYWASFIQSGDWRSLNDNP